MVRINILTNNAAFEDGASGQEVARILRELAERYEASGAPFPVTLRDINGNVVGKAKIA